MVSFLFVGYVFFKIEMFWIILYGVGVWDDVWFVVWMLVKFSKKRVRVKSVISIMILIKKLEFVLIGFIFLWRSGWVFDEVLLYFIVK